MGESSWTPEAPPPVEGKANDVTQWEEPTGSKGAELYPQQLRGEHGDGGGPVSDLVILDLGHVCKHKAGHWDDPTGRPGPAAAPSLTNQNFGGRVVHADGFEDGRAVVGHRHRAALPPAQQDFVLRGEPFR